MSEKALVNKLLRTLRKELINSWWYKIPDPARCPKCGTIAVVSKRPFDLIGCYKGYSIAIEVKTDKAGLKGLYPHQKAELALHSNAHSGGWFRSYIVVGDKEIFIVMHNGSVTKACTNNIVQLIQSTVDDSHI